LCTLDMAIRFSKVELQETTNMKISKWREIYEEYPPPHPHELIDFLQVFYLSCHLRHRERFECIAGRKCQKPAYMSQQENAGGATESFVLLYLYGTLLLSTSCSWMKALLYNK
jgi:hypothetical protein